MSPLLNFLAASFMSPTTPRTSPFALSSLPSASSLRSPENLPAASFIEPDALSAAPLTCSLSMWIAPLGMQEQHARGGRVPDSDCSWRCVVRTRVHNGKAMPDEIVVRRRSHAWLLFASLRDDDSRACGARVGDAP